MQNVMEAISPGQNLFVHSHDRLMFHADAAPEHTGCGGSLACPAAQRFHSTPKETRPGKHFIFSGAQHLSLRVLVVPFLISSASMAPVRGAKKRKRPEKPVPAPAPRLPLPPLPDGSDWWSAFYRRVAGRLSYPSPPSLAASLCSLEFNHVRLLAPFVAISLITVACRKYLVLGNAPQKIEIVRGWIWRELELQFVSVDV